MAISAADPISGANTIAPNPPTQPAAPSQDTGNLSMDIDVVAKRLDIARQQIQPSLGATTYTVHARGTAEHSARRRMRR